MDPSHLQDSNLLPFLRYFLFILCQKKIPNVVSNSLGEGVNKGDEVGDSREEKVAIKIIRAIFWKVKNIFPKIIIFLVGVVMN